MSSVMFAYPDRLISNPVVTTTLSGGAWSGTLPLANLQDRLKSKVARTTNALAASTTFNVDFGTVRTHRLLAVLNHNGSINATIRYQFFSDAGLSVSVYDTGAITMIGDPTLTAEDLYGMKYDFWYVMPANVVARYCKVSILDTGNAAGYFELGRACFMPVWSPAIGVSYNQRMGYDHSLTTMVAAKKGTRFYDRGTPKRTTSGTFESITANEAHQFWLQMSYRLGIDQELFFILNATETDFYKKQQSYLCTAREQDTLENPYFDSYSVGVSFEEVI